MSKLINISIIGGHCELIKHDNFCNTNFYHNTTTQNFKIGNREIGSLVYKNGRQTMDNEYPSIDFELCLDESTGLIADVIKYLKKIDDVTFETLKSKFRMIGVNDLKLNDVVYIEEFRLLHIPTPNDTDIQLFQLAQIQVK